MVRLSRRHFLRNSLAAAALAGCGAASVRDGDGSPITPGDPDAGPPDGGPDAFVETCDDPLAGGELLGLVPLVDNGSPNFSFMYGEGLDARQMFDLSTVRPDNLITAVPDYYVRTSTPDGLPAASTWTVRIHGMVEAAVDIPLADLLDRARDRGAHVMECSGNSTGASFGLMSAARWRGVPVGEILDRARPLPAAARIRFSGYDRHDGPSETSFAGCDWIFSRAQLEEAGAFLATHQNGDPLTLEHGAPVRLYVPGWYGCTCVKWLNEIEFLPDDVAPTFHMLEFAKRTMQDGEPEHARDWKPAVIDQAAMPVRVERWRVGGRVRYLVAGILWGGERPTDKLDVRFGEGDAWRRVEVCPSMKGNATWTPWAYLWDPPGAGTYEIRCRIDDTSIRQRRLDIGYYARRVKITAE
jgi:DMSO/TMAO reductase YedYZ molybdopterin-dependent catalytic subunit